MSPESIADDFAAGLEFAPLAEEDADAILEWQYSGELAAYGFATADPDERAEERHDLLDPANGYHAARTRNGELVGFCCFGPDAQVPGGDYREPALDVGLGLRPDLVGRGLGGAFVAAILDFSRRELAPPLFRLTIATWNRRATLVYERAGFRAAGRFRRTAPGGDPGAEFLVMVRPVGGRA